jgi:hypothetical protein
MMMIL